MSHKKPKRSFIISLLLGIFVVALTGACSSSPPVPTPRTHDRSNIEVANVPPPTPTIAPEATPTAVLPASDESCLSCHTDDGKLQETAKPEEVVESLSEGEG